MTEKYEFIDAERATASDLPTIARMCQLLEVSKSGFYEWRSRPLSAAQRRRELLADKIGALFKAFGGTYGYRRVHAELVRTERTGRADAGSQADAPDGTDSVAAQAISYYDGTGSARRRHRRPGRA